MMTKRLTVVTKNGHHHTFDTRADGTCIWSCFTSKDIPIQCGEVIKFKNPPMIGKPLCFVCKYLQDHDIMDGGSRMLEKEQFFVTMTTKVVDIIY